MGLNIRLSRIVDVIGGTGKAAFIASGVSLCKMADQPTPDHWLYRSPNFDLNTLDALKNRLLQLREARGIGKFVNAMFDQPRD
jgi:hypothetical protein